MTDQNELDRDIADAAGAGPGDEAAPDYAEELLARDKEIAELKDRVLRAAAETENVRRRLEREKQDASAYAVTGFARDLLAVADNLGRAVKALPNTEDAALAPVLAGIAATERELQAVFARAGIARIDTTGASLDPNRHQAMIEVESADHAAGAIVQELVPGYMIKDRLLRAAMVSVAKAKADAA